MPITYKVEVQPQALRDMTEIVTYIADDLKTQMRQNDLRRGLSMPSNR